MCADSVLIVERNRKTTAGTDGSLLQEGEATLKEVVQLFRNETNEWVHVTVGNEEIICTPNHPFYSPVKGWTNACDLRAGNILVTVNGEYVIVEQVQHKLLETPVTVYNFEVEGFHTYYVGDTEVLVHNECGSAKKAQLPTKGKVRYVPPKGAGKNLHRTSNGGYIDKFGNVWEKGPSRTIGEAFEWDVQLSKQGKKILLFCPGFAVCSQYRGERMIHIGDELYDYTFYDAESFIRGKLHGDID